ncbi:MULTISPECIES: hypothetical protein [Rhizobium]|uniref:hypothetical protein n=1 Tax=Rhizobium TaxID=379 RepID=UPI0013DE7146|nr:MULTISPECIES: hypothetical protein [Rhizobium]UWU32840.1 hypothetical protein N2597_11640 [Rhizobium leguminosarum bv. phaseoli]
MNSSIIMFSNMFSDTHFYKHCKAQSSLQRTRRVGRRQRVRPSISENPGNFCGRRTNGTKSGLAAIWAAGYGVDAAPVFPGGFKLGLASAGLFLWADRRPYREYSVPLQDLAFPA